MPSETFANAYALVPVPGTVGKFRALHLTGVIADQVHNLEPEGRGEPALYGIRRVEHAMRVRHAKKGF